MEQSYDAVEEAVRQLASHSGIDPEDVLTRYRQEAQQGAPIEHLRSLEALAWGHFCTLQPVLPEHDKEALLAWAWTAQTFRHVHAAFVLVDHGFHDSAYLQVRAAWELGVYLSLLAGVDHPSEVLDQLARDYFDSSRRALNDLHLSTNDEGRESLERMMGATLGLIPESDDVWATIFRQVCDCFVQGDELYGRYRVLSQKCHPGFGSADLFLAAAFQAGRMTGDPVPTPDPLPDPMLRFALNLALGSTAWAGWSTDKLFDMAMFGDSLKPIGDLGYIPLAVKPSKR